MEITRQDLLQNKLSKHSFALFLFCLVLLTFLRSFLVPLYFIIPILLFSVVPFKVSINFLLLPLVTLACVCILGATGEDMLWANFILSMYIVLTTILFFLCSPIPEFINSSNYELLFVFIRFASYFMIFNNCLGLVQYIIFPVYPVTNLPDDAFIGLYGTHGVGSHGMSIINGLLFLYYFSKFKHDKRKYSLYMFLFFLFSFVMALYGMGLMIMIVTCLSYYLIVKRSLKLILGVLFFIGVIYLFMFIINPVTLKYNINNVKSFVDGFEKLDKKPDTVATRIPRKLFVYYYYKKHYMTDSKRFLIGTGPGTFNSRVSFLLNGDYSPGNPFEKIFGVHNPKYAAKYIYPLWDKKILSKLYFDGTRNQPFSSIISLLAEYGFVFCLILSFVVFKKIKYIIKRLKESAQNKSAVILKDFILLGSLFMLLNLFADNLLEFTEVLFFILLVKFIEVYSIFIVKQHHAPLAV